MTEARVFFCSPLLGNLARGKSLGETFAGLQYYFKHVQTLREQK